MNGSKKYPYFRSVVFYKQTVTFYSKLLVICFTAIRKYNVYLHLAFLWPLLSLLNPLDLLQGCLSTVVIHSGFLSCFS